MNRTPIEWTDFTVNPFRFRNLETGKIGHHCDKISPGCANCYSSAMQAGPYLSGLTFLHENKPKGEFFLDESALQQVLRRKKPARIFWCDMTDMFLADYPDEWIDCCFAVMALAPHLTHQVLTKRAGRMREYFANIPYRQEMIGIRAEDISGLDRFTQGSDETTGCGDDLFPTWQLPLKNVWLGVSVEDQQRADERIPLLLQTPAVVRFLSCEPLLSAIDFGAVVMPDGDHLNTLYNDGEDAGIDWVIVGAESGPGARPMQETWARQIKDQCVAAGVPFFYKQDAVKGHKISLPELDGRKWVQLPDLAAVVAGQR